ncbi:hypothetical protein C1H46_001884 [Malus baccata]|uniref:PNPLA domain-containing protein n=1 Tax=Malus baccata TaxID=106549 RepID=A0A540NPG1_MALBA|nr:hypothetical protein C1H46_001884 [Malus baccata]
MASLSLVISSNPSHTLFPNTMAHDTKPRKLCYSHCPSSPSSLLSLITALPFASFFRGSERRTNGNHSSRLQKSLSLLLHLKPTNFAMFNSLSQLVPSLAPPLQFTANLFLARPSNPLLTSLSHTQKSVLAFTSIHGRRPRAAFVMAESILEQDTLKSMLIPCYDMSSRAPFLFSWVDAVEIDYYNSKMMDVCTATSAQPAVEVRSVDGRTKLMVVDGGIAMNNLTAAAITGIHFIMSGAYTDSSKSGKQYKWLSTPNF